MAEHGGPIGQHRLKRGAYAFYCISFAMIVVFTAISFAVGEMTAGLTGIPMVVIFGLAVFTDRKAIHVPPELIVMVVLAFFLAFFGRLAADGGALLILTNLVTGINLGLLGMILVYSVLRVLPRDREGSRATVSFISICIALSAYTLTRMLQYWIAQITPYGDGLSLGVFMEDLTYILIGALVVAALHTFQRRDSVFDGIVNTFLEENSETIGLEGAEEAAIRRIIEEGESEWTEYKSTLRTNLATGENDKRMEKAVLKTIVAFLNSDGGDLLVGVADDGSVIGADVDSFDGSRDKMGLHLGNLISSQIGSGFLPFITSRIVDIDGKAVIHVHCESCPKPVFLKDGKIEIFYVRKGPQTEELTGNALLSYLTSRGIVLKKMFRGPGRRTRTRCHSLSSLARWRAFFALLSERAMSRVMMTARTVTMIA